jgi:GGDEF domain-containing protein
MRVRHVSLSAEYDAISGVYKRAKFYDITHRMLRAHPDTRYALARFDMDRFRLITTVRHGSGDRLLREFGSIFTLLWCRYDLGRLEAGHFVI